MDVVLTILGIMGLGAIAISTYVFVAAARNYVSDDHRRFRMESASAQPIARNPTDRRSGRSVTFPLAVNSILIARDRRILLDRRLMT
jgi:hypothetical protein